MSPRRVAARSLRSPSVAAGSVVGEGVSRKGRFAGERDACGLASGFGGSYNEPQRLLRARPNGTSWCTVEVEWAKRRNDVAPQVRPRRISVEEHDPIAPPAIDVAHLAIVDADALPREQVDHADCRILNRNWMASP